MSGLGLLKDELHVHLYGCLTASDLFELGRDLSESHAARLDWYAAEYAKAWGRTPDWRAYWSKPSGFQSLREDFEFLTAEPFARFQACFNLGIALLPAAPGDTKALDHVMRAQRAQGLRHVEFRCFIPPVMPLDSVAPYVTALGRAAALCERESGGSFEPRLAFSCSRNPTTFAGQYAALRAAQADPDVRRVVTGIDLCGVEEGNPPRLLQTTLEGVRVDNERDPGRALALLYHVGESWQDKGLASAVRWVHEAHALGVHRLGHALALGISGESLTKDRGEQGARESVAERRDHLRWLLAEERHLRGYGYNVAQAATKAELERLASMPAEGLVDIRYDDTALEDIRLLQDAVLAQLADAGAVVESCLTSNLRIGRLAGPHRHPLRRFLEAGLKVCLSTDDPGTFATDLGQEERLARQAQGLSALEVQRLASNAESSRSSRLVRRPLT